jgi:hypothetical protein
MNKNRVPIGITFVLWVNPVLAGVQLTPIEKKVAARCVSSQGGVFYPTHKEDTFFLVRRGTTSGRPSENVNFVTTNGKCFALFDCALQGGSNTGSSISQIVQTKLQNGNMSYTFFCMGKTGNSQKFEVSIDGMQPKVEEGNPFGADGE